MIKIDENKRFYFPVCGGFVAAAILYLVFASGKSSEASRKEEEAKKLGERLLAQAGAPGADPFVVREKEKETGEVLAKIGSIRGRYGFILEPKYKAILSATGDDVAREYAKVQTWLDGEVKKCKVKLPAELANQGPFNPAGVKALVNKMAVIDRFVQSLGNTGMKEVRLFRFDTPKASSGRLQYPVSVEMEGTYQAFLNWIVAINQEGDAEKAKPARFFILQSFELKPLDEAKKGAGVGVFTATFGVLEGEEEKVSEEKSGGETPEEDPSAKTKAKRPKFY